MSASNILFLFFLVVCENLAIMMIRPFAEGRSEDIYVYAL
jgi:hypothetical protein